MNTIDHPYLRDYRVIRHAQYTVATEDIISVGSYADFRKLESVLVMQIGGNVGDITVNGAPISNVHPHPVAIAGNRLNIVAVNPASIIIYSEKL